MSNERPGPIDEILAHVVPEALCPQDGEDDEWGRWIAHLAETLGQRVPGRDWDEQIYRYHLVELGAVVVRAIEAFDRGATTGDEPR